MLIRSQNKKVLLNLDNLSGIEAVGGVDGTARITANDSSTHYLLGDYSNPEKAMEVFNLHLKQGQVVTKYTLSAEQK